MLVHGQVVQQMIALKHEADVSFVQLGAILGLQPVHRIVEELVLAGPVRVMHPEDGVWTTAEQYCGSVGER